MRTILNILFVILISSNLYSQVWESTNIVSGSSSTRDVYFANTNTGYASVNTFGTPYKIYKTTNKGSNWMLLKDFNNPTTFAAYQNMYFINANTGWVSFAGTDSPGNKAYIYKTTNAGIDWQLKSLTTAPNMLLGEVKFVDGDIGYLYYNNANNSKIFKTTNGGANWYLKFENTTENSVINNLMLSKIDPNFIYASGYKQASPNIPLLLKTTDGFNSPPTLILDGTSDPGSFREIMDLSVINSSGTDFENVGFGKNGNDIYYTSNGGTNWNNEYNNSTYLSGIWSVNDISYTGGNYGNFYTRKLTTNLVTYFDNQSSSFSLSFDGSSYNTPITSHLRGGYSSLSSSNIINPGQSNERIFYKWSDGFMYSDHTVGHSSERDFYFDLSGTTIANYYKTKQLSTVPSAIANPSQTKSVRDTTINSITATHTIHESMGGIFYSKSTNYGATYQTEEIVNLSNDPGADGNKNSYLTTIRNNATYDANRNVVVVWEKYNSQTGKVEIKLSRRVLNTPQTGYEWIPYIDNNGNEMITSFDAPSYYQSNPKCFSVGGPYDTSDARRLVLIIPHLRPNGSQNKLFVSVRYLNQSQDYELDNGEISDLSTVGPYNSNQIFRIHFAYKKGDNIAYRNETIGVDPFNGIYHNLIEAVPNISSGDGYASRYKPDISLMNGIPVVSYSASYNATRLVQYEDGATSYIPINRYPIVKVQRLGTNSWGNYVIYNSNNVQDNSDIEGSRDTKSYLINYSIGNGQFKKVVNVESYPGYFCDPNLFTGTDSKLIRNSYTGHFGSNLSLLTLSPNSSLYKVDKQSFNITNIISTADAVENLGGVINLDTIRYSFNLGPIFIQDGAGGLEGTTFGGGSAEEDPVINGVEFNEKLVSNAFLLNETQALLVGCNATYIKNNAYYSISNIPYTASLYNKTTGQLHRILFQDTINAVDSIEIEYLRGYFITNIPNHEDSFYVKLEVNDAFDDGDYFINPIYYDGEDQETQGPVASLGYQTAVIFEDDNLSVTAVNTIPTEYLLEQNYPNPFNPSTKISYSLPKDGMTKITVYDVAGKEIAILINESKQAGNYDVTFNGSNFSSGVYFYRIESNDFIQTKRMVLIK